MKIILHAIVDKKSEDTQNNTNENNNIIALLICNGMLELCILDMFSCRAIFISLIESRCTPSHKI